MNLVSPPMHRGTERAGNFSPTSVSQCLRGKTTSSWFMVPMRELCSVVATHEPPLPPSASAEATAIQWQSQDPDLPN